MSSSSSSVDAAINALRPKFEAANQGHVFTFFDRGQLNQEEKKQLLEDLELINVANLKPMLEHALAEEKAASAPVSISPFTAITDTAKLSRSELDEYRSVGLRLISEGKAAALLMAGGQGTRLGSSAPKGCYDIGLPSHKSLFQIQAERIIRLKQIAAEAAGKDPSSVSLPWYVMTSVATHSATVSFFNEHNNFGLPSSSIFFFSQAELPALTFDGKIILETKSHIALAPNGNGGIYEALERSGALEDMNKKGIEYTHVYGVDNVLVKVADPLFIGFAHSIQADCANKVVLKTDPKEKVGVMCLKNGIPSVVEYSEIPESLSASRDSNGQLLYSGGNIANHVFSVKFLSKISRANLPFHIARKAIPHVDVNSGELQKPKSPMGIKLEMFVFDAFPLAEKVVGYAVPRSSEFSPVKNAAAIGVIDSPATALSDLMAYHIHQVTAAGGQVQVTDDGSPNQSPFPKASSLFEISPLVSYDGEGLESRVKGQTFTTPYQLDK